MDRLQRIMLANGLLVVLAAMFAGFMLIFSLLGGIEIWPGSMLHFTVYGTSEGWVRAHSGGAMNGLLVIVIALALPKLNLGPTMPTGDGVRIRVRGLVVHPVLLAWQRRGQLSPEHR